MGHVHQVGLVVVAVIVSAAAGAARADTGSEIDQEIARRHFATGSEHYAAGRYAEALQAFEAARRVAPLPAFDFNIGRTHDRLDHPREAIEAYERFLAAAPNDTEAPELRARIKVLRARLPASAAGASNGAGVTRAAPEPARHAGDDASRGSRRDTSPAADRDVTPPMRPERRRPITWTVIGAGGALLVGSLAAGLLANARYSDLASHCAADGACDLTATPGAQSWIDEGRRAGLASDVLLGVGVAAVAAGVVLYFVEGRRSVERSVFQLAPAPGGLALVLP